MNHVATRKVSVRRFKLTNSLDDDERWQQIANKAKAIAAKRRTQNRSTQNPILGGEQPNKQDAKTTSIPQTPSYAKDGRPPSSFFAPDHTPFISKLEPVLLDIENETPLATHSNVITALDTPYASSTQAQINLLKNLPPTTLEWSPSLETPLAKNQCVYPLNNPTLDTPSLRKHSEILPSPKWAAADGNSSLPHQPCLDLPINDDISAFNTTGTIHIDRVTKTRSSNLDGSSNEPPNSTAVGFTTSNGMAIYPSKDSLQRAKHLLDDDNAEDGSMTISRGSWSDKTLKGLSKLALTRPRKFLKNAAGTKFIDKRNQDSSQHQSMENSLASIGPARHPLPPTPIDKEQQHIRSMTNSHEYADSASTTSELTTSNTIVAPASGFLMASGKLPPPLTDEAVSRARNLFDNIMNNTDDHIRFESGYKQVEGPFKGSSNLDYLAVVDLNRSTIGNSNYLSDDKATRNHTNLQRDHDSTTAFHLVSTTIVPDSTHNQPSSQIVEQESLQKIYTSHAVDKDNTGPAESSTDTSEEFNEGTSTIYQNQSHQEFVGFKSASGKQLPYVSEAAINRGKSLVGFGDVPLEPLEVQPADSTTQTIDDIQRPEVCHVPPVISFCGFKTAGGKPPPKLSDDAIKRGQALMESVAQEFSVDHKFGMSSQAEFVSEPRAMKPASKIACDFVPNSDGNSLLPNANMHEEGVAFFKTDENVGFRHNASSADWVDSDDSAKLGSVGASRQMSSFSGFSTAGGKPPPEISAAALSKARSLLKSVEDSAREDGLFGEPAFPIENLGCSAKTNVQSSFSGFATASGKAPPTISAASLRRATKFFQSEDSNSVDLMEFDSSVPTADSLKIDSNSNTQPKSPKALQLFKKPQNVFKVPMQISRVSQNPVTPKIAAPVARQYQTPTSLTSSTTTTPSSFKTPQHLSGRKASRSHRKPFKTPFSAKKQHTVEVKASTSTKTVVIKKPMFNLSAKHERIKLSEEFRTFIKGKPAQEDSPVGVPEVNSTSAIHYEFVLPTETSSTATWSATEAYAELIESGALPTAIDERWVLNHYRWIVWKLASYLKLNPTKYKELWTPDHVMQQLKYRYEREINQGHRSALKLVIERDGVPSRYMVLCVSDIVEVPRSSSSHTSFHLELTDGWYKIRATIDSSIQRAVKAGRIFVGQKLAIFNAQLLGGSDAVPALDVPDSTVLKITGNSTKRARWHAKLGFQKEKFFEVSLNSLMPDGGSAPAVDVVVMRVYPILYLEASPSGRKITRSAQEEENAAAAYEADIEAELQKLLVSYQTTGDLKRSNDMISKAINQSSESSTGYQSLNDQEICAQKMDRIREELADRVRQAHPPRNVTPYIKVRLCDYPKRVGKKKPTTAMMTIWRPQESAMEYFKEGNRLRLINANVSAPSKESASEVVQLHTARNTVWQELPADDEVLKRSLYTPRSVTPFAQLEKLSPHSEVDVVGLVMDVSKKQNARRSNGRCMEQFEVFLADQSGRFILVQILRNSGEYKTSFLRINTIVTMTNVIVSTYDAKFDLHILKSTDFTEIKLFPKSIYLREAKAEFDDWMKRNPNIINSLSERLADFKAGRPIVRQHSAGKAEATLTFSENQNLAPAHSENSMLHSASTLNLPSPPSLPPYNFIPRKNDKIDWVDYFLDALDRNPSESSEDCSKSETSRNQNATGDIESISHSRARYLESKSHSLLGYVESIQVSLDNNPTGQLIQSLNCTLYFDSGVDLLKLNSTISSVLSLLISCISESMHSFSPSTGFDIHQFQLNPMIFLTSTSTHSINQIDADNAQNVDTWMSAFNSTRSKIWTELGITKLPIQEYLRWWICNARVYSSKSLVDGYNEMRATKSELSVDEYLWDISIKREPGDVTLSEYIQVDGNLDKYNLVILEGELMNLIDCLNQFIWKDYVEIEVAESTAKVEDQRDATGTEPSTGLVLKKLEMVDTSSRFHQLLSLLYTEENRV